MASDLEYTKQSFKLNTGDKIPALGLGTWQSPPGQVRNAVKVALQTGYRHIDTAMAYGNEKEVGEGIKDSGVPRKEIWITTKLDNPWHHRVEEGINTSLKNLDVEYVDLYLIHWPCAQDPEDLSKVIPDWNYINTWEAMQKIGTGRAKNIGVSNFGIQHLEKLFKDPSFKTTPAVNQIELHPNCPSPKLLDYCKSKGIHCTAYSCLGSTDSPLYKNEALIKIAEAKGKTVQQVLLLWGLSRGTSVIPKSVTASRIEKNYEIDGSELTSDEITTINSMKERFKVCDEWLPEKIFFGDDE